MDTTYRLVVLGDRERVGQTALTPELAKLVPPDIDRLTERLGIELTEWIDHFERKKVVRTILIDAEPAAGDWIIGA